MNRLQRRHVVVMAKFPRLGTVKTRLASAIGPVAAVRWYRTMLWQMLSQIVAPKRWQLWVALSPDEFVSAKGHFILTGAGRTNGASSSIGIRSQGRGDLGARIWEQLSGLDGDVLVIGSDISGVTPSAIAAAFDNLAGSKYVIGPCADGGFWLIGRGGVRGLRRSVRSEYSQTLGNLPWSVETTRQCVVARLEAHSLAPVNFVQQLSDIDTIEDLHNANYLRRQIGGESSRANR